MPKLTRWLAVEVVAWVGVAFAAWHFVAAWTKPGRCLSRGGSFNYQTWGCGYVDNYPYVDVPAYLLPAFWLLVAAASVAVVLRVMRKRRAI